MQVRFPITTDDQMAVATAIWCRTRTGRAIWKRQIRPQFILIAITLAAVAVMGIVDAQSQGLRHAAIKASIILAILLPLIAWRFWSYRRGPDGISPAQRWALTRLRRSLERDGHAKGVQTIELLDDGIRSTLSGDAQEYAWSSIADVLEENERLVFRVSAQKACVVPRSAFPSAAEYTRFVHIVRSRATGDDGASH